MISLSNITEQYKKKHQELLEKYGEDFAKESEQFGVNRAEAQVIREWLESLKPELLAIQKQSGILSEGLGIMENEVYYGATGGGVSYTFVPTSLGTILEVKEAITGKTLNVTAALDWYFYG